LSTNHSLEDYLAERKGKRPCIAEILDRIYLPQRNGKAATIFNR